RVRLPGIRAGVYPSIVLRGQRAVPLGGTLGRGFGHRADGPTGAGNVSAKRALEALDPDGAEESEIPGAALAHLLAGLRRAGQIRTGDECPGRQVRIKGAHRDRTRSPGLRLRGFAVPRNGSDEGRLGRDCGLAAAERAG